TTPAPSTSKKSSVPRIRARMAGEPLPRQSSPGRIDQEHARHLFDRGDAGQHLAGGGGLQRRHAAGPRAAYELGMRRAADQGVFQVFLDGDDLEDAEPPEVARVEAGVAPGTADEADLIRRITNAQHVPRRFIGDDRLLAAVADLSQEPLG